MTRLIGFGMALLCEHPAEQPWRTDANLAIVSDHVTGISVEINPDGLPISVWQFDVARVLRSVTVVLGSDFRRVFQALLPRA